MANLTQLKMLEALKGFLLVDKPAGLPFATVVKTVKRKFNLVKVGHGGSLDAAASGLMVLLLGDANKSVGDIMGGDRAYTGTVRFGLRTNTGDVQGATLAESAARPTAETLARAASLFRGDVFQTEPRFCAVRREGTGGYDLADTGDHAQFLAHVYRFDLELAPDAATATFSLAATKGVIVRALADDLGAELGCGAALAACRRTRLGPFDLSDAIPFDRLLETESADLPGLVRPLR